MHFHHAPHHTDDDPPTMPANVAGFMPSQRTPADNQIFDEATTEVPVITPVPSGRPPRRLPRQPAAPAATSDAPAAPSTDETHASEAAAEATDETATRVPPTIRRRRARWRSRRTYLGRTSPRPPRWAGGGRRPGSGDGGERRGARGPGNRRWADRRGRDRAGGGGHHSGHRPDAVSDVDEAGDRAGRAGRFEHRPRPQRRRHRPRRPAPGRPRPTMKGQRCRQLSRRRKLPHRASARPGDVAQTPITVWSEEEAQRLRTEWRGAADPVHRRARRPRWLAPSAW